MTYGTDPTNPELNPSARTRVRLPGPKAPTRLFQGWGPSV